MVDCDHCGKKINFFERFFYHTYDYEDENGNPIKYCYLCNDTYSKARENERIAVVKDICKKYLISKETQFQAYALVIIKSDELFLSIRNETADLTPIRDKYNRIYEISQRRPSNARDYDENLNIETTATIVLEFINDLEKIKRILEKKGVLANYRYLTLTILTLLEEEKKRVLDYYATDLYKRISNLGEDKRRIVKNCIKQDPNISEEIVNTVLRKFGINCGNNEVATLIAECMEDLEIEDFENNLGRKKTKRIGDFENLNGHQFEEYLKGVFSNLGYQVIKTKGSGDQGADLILKKDDEKTVVQAKKYSGAVSNKAIQEVVASKRYYGAEKAMVVTTGTFTNGAMELARSNNVELWDRQKLKAEISRTNNN